MYTLGNFDCRNIYQGLISTAKYNSKAKLKWISQFSNMFALVSWDFYCSLPFNCTNDVRLRWFQYKIVHRIFPTNVLLQKIKVIDNNRCSFCSDNEESLQHLFFNCNYVQTLWLYLNDLFQKHSIKVSFLDPVIILLGGDFNKVLNVIIILVKFYIFHSKVKKTIPTVEGLRRSLKDYFELQRGIHFRNMSPIWERYWLPWFNFLQLNLLS